MEEQEGLEAGRTPAPEEPQPEGLATGGDVPAAAGPASTATDPQIADPQIADPLMAEPTAQGLEGMARQGWEILQAGGPVVAILLVLSVIALAIVLVKLIQFRAARLGDGRTPRDALALYRAGRAPDALALAGRSRNPVARVLVRAINGRNRRDLPEALVREEVVRYGGDLLESLRGWFRPLEVIGSLAPLLGLFGTVLGMISAFQQLEAAGNQVNPAVLSGGIWEALLTTAVGLAVAMPTIVLLNWLERRVDRLAHEMDSVVTQVFTEDLSRGPRLEPAVDSREASRREEAGHGAADSRAPALVAGR